MIHFLESRIHREFRVFEYGAGNSTIWFGRRVAEVVSVEANEEWAKKVASAASSNVRIITRKSTDAFSGESTNGHGLFDIVLIDGGDRLRCLPSAVRALKPEGVIIWDNTDGPDWPVIRTALDDHGFREISFLGMVPQELCLNRTTLFYRRANCLGI